ncbi:MAG: DUF115 domain-containing protein [Lachnospiraceae bacterium]|nr:DUF115 domain-containing protein [Lachnospiraceae bacterium]
MRLKNCKGEEFIAALNGRKVICFGAGSTLIEADYEVLKIDDLEKYIAFFVDNDRNKHGLKFEYCGQQFDIKSVETLNTIDVREYVLLITCAFYVEIYHQLKDVAAIKDMECYMYNAVCSYPNLNVERFFTREIEKSPYKEWKKILSDLKLKSKYKGQRCFIIGNGPSLRIEDLELLKGEITFGANRIFKLFENTDWRPTYYLCTDYLMYGLDHKEINRIDAQLRFVPIERALAAGEIYDEITYYNRTVNCVSIKNGKIIRSKEFEFSDNIEEVVRGGQTVLYDAIQIAVYMGFSEIYLYGVDCDYKFEVLEDGTIVENDVKENHFSKSYDEGLEDAIAVVAPLYAARLAFQKGKEECEARGIIIKNATRGGKLEVFERTSLEELLGK